MVDRYSAEAIALIHGDFREKRGGWVKYQDYEKLYQDYETLEQERDQLKRSLAVYENTDTGTFSTLELKKENQRLRDALEKIADTPLYDQQTSVRKIAKQALEDKND